MVKTIHQNFIRTFRNAIENTASACVGCGKCYEVCPITDAAQIGGLNAQAITSSVRGILKGTQTDVNAEIWANSCVLSGECIGKCDYGVNPRLMLAMARMVLSERKLDSQDRKSQGLGAFKALGNSVKVLSKMQLEREDLDRLGQGKTGKNAHTRRQPDYVFYTGCNVLKTPHIALLCLDIMDALNLHYEVLGGPSHCCGILQYRAGDIETSSKVATNSIEKFIRTGAKKVLSWCPTCQVQYAEFGLPTYEKVTNSKPFEMTPFVLFLETKIQELKPLLRNRVEQKIALHLHPGIHGLPEAARNLLRAVPGIEIIDLELPEIGLMSNSLSTVPRLKKNLQRDELKAAEAAGIDALAAVYHADHRELCAHERDMPFQIINFLEIIGAAMGIYRNDYFKSLKIKQDSEAILADCAPILSSHGISNDQARPIIESALLGEQPLPLRGQ